MKEYEDKIKIVNGAKYVINFDEHAPHVDIPIGYIKYWSELLSTNEFAIAYSLSSWISECDNSLKIGNKYLDIKDMSEKLEEKYNLIKKIIYQLIKHRAICECYTSENTSIYFLNPTIACHKDELVENVFDIFNGKKIVKINDIVYTNKNL